MVHIMIYQLLARSLQPRLVGRPIEYSSASTVTIMACVRAINPTAKIQKSSPEGGPPSFTTGTHTRTLGSEYYSYIGQPAPTTGVSTTPSALSSETAWQLWLLTTHSQSTERERERDIWRCQPQGPSGFPLGLPTNQSFGSDRLRISFPFSPGLD